MQSLNRLLVILFLISYGLYSCDNHETPFNCAKSDLSLNVDLIEVASGCNISDGSITVAVQGGKEPYKFQLNNHPSQTTGVFTNLLPGIYSAKVVDANSCETTSGNINVTATGFVVSADVASDNFCIAGNGMVTVNVEDGQFPPYEYQMGGQSFSANNVFTGLQEGNHVITVKDNSDCTVHLNVTIPHGNSGTSWISEIKPIMETRCALSGCHDGQYRPDLRLYDKTYFYRDLIKKYTQDGSMPFDGPKLSKNQVQLITCWVDDGAPQN